MNNLDDSLYAYPAMRKYPVHTKEAALKSYQQYQSEKETYSEAKTAEIEAIFKHAAEYYDTELEPQVKKAANAETAFEFSTEDGGKIRISALKTAENVDAAASFILEKRASMTRKQLKNAAKGVLFAAANLDVSLDTPKMAKIARIAGIGVGNRDQIQYEFEKRATLNIYTGKNNEAFWDYANEMRALSDEAFYKEANLNTICDTLEEIDSMYGNQVKYGTVLKAPEDVVFGDTVDDLLKEAADLAYIESIDTTISKKALLERETAANSFLQAHFEQPEALKGEDLIQKVASLDAPTATALLEAIE